MGTRADQKLKRRKLIMELLKREEICSHNVLQEKLLHMGMDVNQATLSRDLREMGVLKAPGTLGSRYVLPEEDLPATRAVTGTLSNQILSVARSANIIVVKTPPGFAQSTALALDRMVIPGILGTIAGDDTVLVVLDLAAGPDRVEHQLRTLAQVPDYLG